MKFSVVVARRVVGASPLSFRPNTPARDGGYGFPRRHRLTRGAELKATIQEGKRIRTVNLDVRTLASPLSHPRVGIVVPRHRQSAVDRNRLKRRIRELVRIDLLPALKARTPVDVVIRARIDAYAAGFAALRADILAVQRRVGGDFAGSQPAK